MRIKDTLDDVSVRIEEIYVPAGRRHDVKPEVVAELAESILEEGLKVPISVREGDGRYVLVSGLQRLEACKALGEETITAIIVQARQH
jgi:sulfiredoxin